MPRGDNLRRLSDDDRAEIVRRYTTRLPDGAWEGSKAIAGDYGVRPTVILYHLRRAGVAIRNGQEAHAHGKRCKPITNLPVGDAPACKCRCGAATAWNQRKNSWNVYVDGHYRRDAPYKSRAWLHEHYVVKTHTLEEIAALCGVAPSVIARRMRTLGIPARDRSASRIGRQAREKNPAWKGGVTPERQRLYKAGNWRQFVQQVYARDGFHCCRCGSPKRTPKGLHAHHIRPWADDVALRFEPSNIVTLCRKCHQWVHSLANTEREYLI